MRTSLRRRQNNNQKQTVTYIVLLILIIIFLGTVGIQFVLKASLFIAGLSSKSEVKKIEESGVLIEPEIDGLPDATNAASLHMEGRVSEKTMLEIYVNEDKVEEMETPDGTFSTEITLKTGENNIYVRSLDEKKVKSKDSVVYNVLYISKKPELTITNPSNGQETDKDEITIAGTASENAVVKVNGLPTIVNASGSFTRVVQLSEGENTIIARAIDLAGSSVEKQIKVIYRKD